MERKLKLITMLASGTALFITCIGFVTYDFFAFRRLLQEDVLALAGLVGDAAALGLESQFKKDVQDSVDALSGQQHIVAACVYDKKGEEFGRYIRPGQVFTPPPAAVHGRKFSRGRLGVSRLITLRGDVVGSIYIESDLDELHARLKWHGGIALGFLLVALAAAYMLTSRLQKVISRPLLSLAGGVRSVSRDKNYSVRVPPEDSRDELALLVDGFNEMLEQIEQRDGALRETHEQLEKRVEERTRELQQEVQERKQAERVVQQQLTRISLLNRITHAISERQDVQSILSVVLQQVDEHFSVWSGAFYLFDAEKRCLTLAACRSRDDAGPVGRFAANVSLDRMTGGQLRRCVEGITVYLPDARVGELAVGMQTDVAVRSTVAVPLMVENKLFGLLVAMRADIEGFSSADCEFLKMLGEQVALAGHHARLYTELQGAYDELRQTQQAVMQHERLRALGQLASGIAHDINNALSPVMGFAELLVESEKNLTPTGTRYLRHIQTSSEDITHIVSRLREFYRQREDSHELKPVAVNDLIGQVIDLTRPKWRDMSQEHGISIAVQTDFSPSSPPVLGIDSEIREALTNLVLNAVDAMPRGGTVTIRTRAESSTCPVPGRPPEFAIEVQDTGLGMDEETRKRCLEPFFSTKGIRGTGLGLAMVYGIMERHDGRIEIDSSPGKGTTMRLIFPVREQSVARSAPDIEDTSPIKPMRILVVDDEPLLRQLVQGILETDGHAVVAADGGEKGLAEFREALAVQPFDVVITDLGMPGLDGRRLTTLLKQHSPSTPVIMLTGWGALMRAEGDVPAHVDAILSKPPRIKELRNALRQVRASQMKAQELVGAHS